MYKLWFNYITNKIYKIVHSYNKVMCNFLIFRMLVYLIIQNKEVYASNVVKVNFY